MFAKYWKHPTKISATVSNGSTDAISKTNEIHDPRNWEKC
jgi:hypothetical protein